MDLHNISQHCNIYGIDQMSLVFYGYHNEL
jgi:hypothetical protein